MTVYQIEYTKYSNFYLFYNSENCVDKFLQNVKQRFHATSRKWFKCSFTIQNTQNLIADTGQLKPMIVFVSLNIYFTLVV